MGTGEAVVSVASREPVDVERALKDARKIKGDAALAKELARIAIDADNATILPLLQAVERIQDELWRARTLFSLFRQTHRRLTRKLPKAAQNEIVALVKGIADEVARTVALRNLSADLPVALRTRLASLGKAIADPLLRLQVELHYTKDPDEEQTRSFLEAAKGIEEEEARGEALEMIAPLLGTAQLEETLGRCARRSTGVRKLVGSARRSARREPGSARIDSPTGRIEPGHLTRIMDFVGGR